MSHLHHHKEKIISQISKNLSFDRNYKHSSNILRSLFLLLLLLYAAKSFLKIKTTHPLSSSLLLDHHSFSFDRQKEKFSASYSDSVLSIPEEDFRSSNHDEVLIPCSSLVDGTLEISREFLCCDRSQYRTDTCYMKGDVRTHSSSSSIFIYSKTLSEQVSPETIKPYTRKWEHTVMETIDEVTLSPARSTAEMSSCDVIHKGVPAVVFSTGGYTGNAYHEFNDGLIPLYITARRFEGEVVFVVLEYHSWWMTKYRDVVRALSNYKIVDFSKDRRVHCFGEVIVGLKIHGELTVNPQLMHNGEGILDFQKLLSKALQGDHNQSQQVTSNPKRPKIVIFIRHGSRVLLNLREIIKACHRTGFDVVLLKPRRGTPLTDIHSIVSTADAMLAVHGAAVTHFLFMRPSAVLIQIVPLGLDWAADTYYGGPARKLGLEYIAYKVDPAESSLSKVYHRRDPVIANPRSITSKGWWETKKVYLDKQNVSLNIKRFTKELDRACRHVKHTIR